MTLMNQTRIHTKKTNTPIYSYFHPGNSRLNTSKMTDLKKDVYKTVKTFRHGSQDPKTDCTVPHSPRPNFDADKSDCVVDPYGHLQMKVRVSVSLRPCACVFVCLGVCVCGRVFVCVQFTWMSTCFSSDFYHYNRTCYAAILLVNMNEDIPSIHNSYSIFIVHTPNKCIFFYFQKVVRILIGLNGSMLTFPLSFFVAVTWACVFVRTCLFV